MRLIIDAENIKHRSVRETIRTGDSSLQRPADGQESNACFSGDNLMHLNDDPCVKSGHLEEPRGLDQMTGQSSQAKV